MRQVEPRLHHEVEGVERLVGLVDAVDEVERLQREVDDEGVEEVARDRVDALHVDLHAAQPGDGHVEQHHRGDPGDDGREEEDDRHERRRPPGVGLHRAEDEPDVAVEQEGRGDADERDHVAHPVVDAQRLLAHVVRAEGEQPVDEAERAGRGLGQPHDVLAVVEPDLQQEHGHQVPEVDEAEHRHGRGGVGRQVHLEGALRVAEVQLQRQRRHQEERERGQQRQAVGGLHRLHPEDALERGEDEGARHEPGDVGVEDDQDAPLELHLVGVHEPLDAVQDALHTLAGEGGALSPPRESPSGAPGACRAPLRHCASRRIFTILRFAAGARYLTEPSRPL